MMSELWISEEFISGQLDFIKPFHAFHCVHTIIIKHTTTQNPFASSIYFFLALLFSLCTFYILFLFNIYPLYFPVGFYFYKNKYILHFTVVGTVADLFSVSIRSSVSSLRGVLLPVGLLRSSIKESVDCGGHIGSTNVRFHFHFSCDTLNKIKKKKKYALNQQQQYTRKNVDLSEQEIEHCRWISSISIDL